MKKNKQRALHMKRQLKMAKRTNRKRPETPYKNEYREHPLLSALRKAGKGIAPANQRYKTWDRLLKKAEEQKAQEQIELDILQAAKDKELEDKNG